MKVDYHIHLEEGPYSQRWVDRTYKAITHFAPQHTSNWTQTTFYQRMKEGEYSTTWLDLYLQTAKDKGLTEIGIVDHLYRFKETRAYFERYIDLSHTTVGELQRTWLDKVMTESMDHFVQSITEAKKRFAQEGITLRLGIEADYFLGGEKELASLLSNHPWDYVIGSVHFLDGWGFDNPDTQHMFESLHLPTLYEQFFHVVEKAIRSNLFDFVAHLDNMKCFNYRPDETTLLPLYGRIAKALKETNTATEINAGLYYRYPVQEMCPSLTFLQLLTEYGVAFTTSSDAHFPDDLGNYVEQNTRMLRTHGINQIATFHNRKRIMKDL
ncbi:histidinol phosphate phosphatase domain-containing protein [Priestia taiwanensis]|uniref:Histidinol-phosphatase n=1 Tax=Priestia taiwanensis TaxID=1347902 RepID=A0A917AUB3_9BACI|nr:histidinol phosphate phosphatase domain-containing protein [Priestia taiwanensis]MBM7365213.1 histidinol-phosphatase (PHP family) [Priestia taiwanensis]GGE73647.1 histidinol-phosphatase [Priestia taiwanensis]